MNIKGQSHSLTLVQDHFFESTVSNFFSLETARLIEAIFHVEPPRDGRTKVCSNGPGHMTNMATMLIYGKNLKNLLLWNQKADDLESCYATSGIRVLSNLSKWCLWVDLDLFYGNVKFGPLCYCIWEKGKTMGFSETVVVCDITVGRCIQIKWEHEALWVPEVKVIHWSWSKSLRFNIFTLLFLNKPLILTYPQHSGERYRTNGPLVYLSHRLDKGM